MSSTFTLLQLAQQLGVSTASAAALCELVFGEARDVFTADDVAHFASVQAQLTQRRKKSRVSPAAQDAFDFAPPLATVTPLFPATSKRDAESAFSLGLQLEETNAPAAVEAYEDAVAADPYHGDAHVNLGRLLHQRGRLPEAEAHYVAALVARPTDATACFNLAVVLEDQGRLDDAIARYREALELDPRNADACFNLARLYEKKGEKVAAIRHLKDLRRLTRGA